jgi:integrase
VPRCPRLLQFVRSGVVQLVALHPPFFYQGTRSGEAAVIRWHQIDLDRGAYAPIALKNKSGDNRLRRLHPIVIASLRPMEGSPACLVFDTSNLVKLFRRACLKLSLGRKVWLCGNCGGEV